MRSYIHRFQGLGCGYIWVGYYSVYHTYIAPNQNKTNKQKKMCTECFKLWSIKLCFLGRSSKGCWDVRWMLLSKWTVADAGGHRKNDPFFHSQKSQELEFPGFWLLTSDIWLILLLEQWILICSSLPYGKRKVLY